MKLSKRQKQAAIGGAAGLGILGAALLSGGAKRNTPIRHWIMLLQENRTFDMYFTGYPGTSKNPNASQMVAITNQADGGGTHNQGPAAMCWNNGKMLPADFQKNEGSNTMHYYPSTVPGVSNYWTLAQEFTLMDNFFSSWMGPSLTNHIVNLTATHCDPSGFCVENNIVPPKGSLTMPTIFDLLDAKGVSWRYYGTLGNIPAGNNLWAIAVLFKNFPNYSVNVHPNINVLTDVTGPEADFPEVSWIIPPGPEVAGGAYCWSEHPFCGPMQGYDNWTGPIISKIMANKPLWESCAILLTYDDFGGYYDHVPPPTITPAPIKPPPEQVLVSGKPNSYTYGFRVPAIMISPFAKNGFVDHTRYDFTSFLATIEAQYGLGSLNGLDKVANDFLTHTPFDFKKKPIDARKTRSFRPDHAAKVPPRRLREGEWYFDVDIPKGEEIE